MSEQIPIRDLKVNHYMTTDPIRVNSDVNFPGGVAVMAIKGIGNLIVTQDQIPTGILSEREILDYLSNDREIPSILLANMVIQQFLIVHPNTTVLEAARIMIQKKHRILVFGEDEYDNKNSNNNNNNNTILNNEKQQLQHSTNKNDKLVGIITASDMVRVFSTQTTTNLSLESVMSRRIFGIDVNNHISRAIDIMSKRNIGSVIVNKDEKPYGIFTERDLLTKVLSKEASLNEKVGDYCSKDLITASIRKTGITALEAAMTMRIARIKRLPLRKDGKIVGIVTARDLVELYQSQL
jgi:CBS domain-containing protein